MVAAASTLGNIQAITWDQVREYTLRDSALQMLHKKIEDGFQDVGSRSDLPPEIREFFQFRDGLSTVDGVILYNNRIVIPPPLRQPVLDTLHSAHQGVYCMTSRAESSVFWPGITPVIANMRARCRSCNERAPSQPHGPPHAAQEPVYPFQCICSDYFKYKGRNYVVIVDRYSGWPIVQQSQDGAEGLVKCLREIFVTYGIADELSTDGGPEFTAERTQCLLSNWGVHHRISSVALAHSNGRAELGVKSCKRMLMDNTGPNGETDLDKFQRAMLQYRNTPDQDTGLSPAQMIFGRPIKDFIPIMPGMYRPHNTWVETARAREEAMRARNVRNAERLAEHTIRLRPLKVGDRVFIQNQSGNHPLRWDRTGLIIEVKQFDQYAVKVDGSGRVTLRNRKFIRKFDKIVVDRMGENTRSAQPPPIKDNTEKQPPANQRRQEQVPPAAQQPQQTSPGRQAPPTPHSVPLSTQQPPRTPVAAQTPLRYGSPTDAATRGPPSGSESLNSPSLCPHSPDAGPFHGFKSSRIPGRRRILTDEEESVLDGDTVPHTASTPTPPPVRHSPRETRPPARYKDYIRYED